VPSVITILLVNLGQQSELFDPTSSSTSADISDSVGNRREDRNQRIVS